MIIQKHILFIHAREPDSSGAPESRHVAAGAYVLSPSYQFSFVAWSPNQGTGKVGTQFVLTDGRPVKVTIMVWNIQFCLRRTSHYLRIPECPVQLYNCLFDFIHRAYYWINDPHPPFFSSQKCSFPLTPPKKERQMLFDFQYHWEALDQLVCFVGCFAIFGPTDKKLLNLE